MGIAGGGDSVATLVEPQERLLGGEIGSPAGEIEVRPPTMEAAARHEELVRGERSLRLRRSAPGSECWR